MRLAHLARDWVFVVGTPIGVIFIISRQVALGIFLIGLFGLSAYLMHRAAERARQGMRQGRPAGGGSTTLLIWGQILVLLSFLWVALFSEIAAQVFLLIATLPPGIMAVIAGFQLRRKSDARISS